jgi:hypothetical protein
MFLQEVRSGAFKILEIVGVIDHAAAIGVFIIDPDFHRIEGIHLKLQCGENGEI